MEKNEDLVKEMQDLGVVALEADGELTRDAAKAVLGLIRKMGSERDVEAGAAHIAALREKSRQSTLEVINGYRSRGAGDAR